MDFQLDWLCLYFQIILLLAISIREIFRKRGRNLYAILIPLTLLILVQGQTWWMLNIFEENDFTEIDHLYQPISIEGLRLANRYACLCIVSLGITYAFFSLRKKSMPREIAESFHTRFRPAVYHVFIAILTVSFGLIIIQIAGGFIAAVSNPGMTLVHGLVFFLMLLWLGKLPVLDNMAIGRRNTWLDVTLFIFVLFLFLINSRTLVSVILLQLILLFNYCRREIQRKTLLESSLIFFLIFFVFGIYRHYMSQYGMIQQDLFLGFIVDIFSVKNLFDWFYRFNVEGFAGLAGLLTYETNQGGIDHDFGLSNISVLFQFIPSSLRYSENLPFKEMKDFFSSLYPYVGYPYATGSVVPSGMENAYAHFGLPGLLGLGVLLGFLMQWLHDRMSQPKADRLMVAIVSVHALLIVHGSFYVVIFFVLSELIILFLYRFLIRIPKILSVHSHRHA